MYNLEDIEVELEEAGSLLVLTHEFLEEIPVQTDKERAYKLEFFCQRQDLLHALINAVSDKLNRILNITRQLQINEVD